MKQGLTKREQILISTALVVVVIYVLSTFVVRPIYTVYTNRQLELEQLQAEKEMIDLKLEQEPFTKQIYDNALLKFQDITERYPSVMANEELDRLLTNLCKANQLNPTRLGMSVITSSKSDVEGQEDSSRFHVATASMNVVGDYKSIQNLISVVNGMEYIRISSLSLSDRSIINEGGSATISIVFEVVMYKGDM